MKNILSDVGEKEKSRRSFSGGNNKMANIKDAKVIMNIANDSLIKVFFKNTFFYLHFLFWLILIASFGIVAEF